MFDWLFRRRPVVRKHSQKEFERITHDEEVYIAYHLLKKQNGPPCPDCGQGYFLAGPEGGNSVNCRCDHCGAEFNLCIFGNAVFGERIIAKGTKDQSRDWCYSRTYYGNPRPGNVSV